MILASVLCLEMLSWQARITVALPDTIGKKSFQGHFLRRTTMLSTTSAAFTAKHI